MMNMMDLRNHFLVAMPQLDDDYFYRAVVYICEHNKQGAMGLVVSQPTDLSLAELCVKFDFLIKGARQYPNQLVLAGGPVNVERGFILHTVTPQSFQHSYYINDRLALTTSADILSTFCTALSPEKYLLALGCATWESNQLETEIANNDWLVVPANESILFDVPYEERWAETNKLLGIQHYQLTQQVGHS